MSLGRRCAEAIGGDEFLYVQLLYSPNVGDPTQLPATLLF